MWLSWIWGTCESRRCPWRPFSASAPVASFCTPEYGVAPERIGYYARGGQETIPIPPAGWLFVLWEVDKVRYVPPCGYISFGFGSVVAVPGVLVYRVEGHSTGLYGPCPGAHDVPLDIKSASLEKFFPPWTVRQICVDSLKPCHSGVSTDVLLFSDINLSLVHHYRVFKRGLPHCVFRRDYLTSLRVFVSQATALAQCDMASPVPASSVSPRHARPCDVAPESPRNTRRARRRMRPTRVHDEPVRVPSPTIADQAIPDFAGAVVYDCRPPLLPVLLRLKDIALSPRVRPVASVVRARRG